MATVIDTLFMVSTHSRLKAAGFKSEHYLPGSAVSTHSRLKAAGLLVVMLWAFILLFQHTAA